MPSIINMKVLGAKEIEAALKQFGSRVAKNTVKRAMRPPMNLIRDAARANLKGKKGMYQGVRYGFLRRSIVAAVDQKSNTNTEIVGWIRVAKNSYEVVIDTEGKPIKWRKVSAAQQKLRKRLTKRGEIYPRRYAHLVEFGTAGHYAGKGGKRGPWHPGARPIAFMRPAYDAKKVAAVELFAKTLEAEIAKEAEKIRKSMPSNVTTRAGRAAA